VRNFYDTCIVGAGIIGLATAFRLTQAGQSVLLIDRKGMAEEASWGNAGAFAFADVEPLASPATLLRAPKWLIDPLGPLSMPISYAPKMVPWMLRFARASLPDRHEASTRAQAALMELSQTTTETMFADARISDRLRRDGAIYLYEGKRASDAAAPVWALRARHGVVFEPVSGDGLAALQPGLGASYCHGVFVPNWMTVTDPHEVAVAIGKAALARGASLEIGEVAEVGESADGGFARLQDGRRFAAKNVVIACGAWSHKLAAGLGDKIPLETERGYNTTLPPGAFALKRQLVLPADGYVVTPLATGIRVGGAAELAGLDRAPDFRRSEMMLKKATRVMPGLNTLGGKQWMGFRPSLPDSLPVIGAAPRAACVVYAFGHGHLGLTQSAGTARLVSDIVLKRSPAIDLRPYRPERF
jgi:D-amino-acid dehydrogenase